jgi:hypothetical protein
MTSAAGSATVIALLSLVAAGCAITPYAEQTDAVGRAAATFKAQATGLSPIPAVRATLSQAVMLRGLVQGAPPPLSFGCGQAVDALNRRVAADVGAGVSGPRANPAAYAAIDRDYQDLRRVPLCGPFQEPRPAAPTAPAVVTALDQYFDGLRAIVEAKDLDAVVRASETLSASLGSLASSAKAPAAVQAAPGFLAKVAKMAIAQAQYAAVRRYVLAADPLFDAAAPSLTSALRLQQGYWAAEVAQTAATGMITVNATLNDPALAKDPALKLTVWDRTRPILEAFDEEQEASRTDPAAAVRGLVNAHHALAASIRSGRGQASVVLNNAVGLATSAKALTGR